MAAMVSESLAATVLEEESLPEREALLERPGTPEEREALQKRPGTLNAAATPPSPSAVKLTLSSASTEAAAKPPPMLDDSLWSEEDGDDDEEEGFKGWATWTPASFRSLDELLAQEKDLLVKENVGSSGSLSTSPDCNDV